MNDLKNIKLKKINKTYFSIFNFQFLPHILNKSFNLYIPLKFLE